MLKILKYQQYDVVNGPGIRCSIWLAGCNNRCKGCWSPQTWNPLAGVNFIDVADKIQRCVDNPKIDGISILGGDPLYWIMKDDLNFDSDYIADSISNVRILLKMCKASNKPVWLWTGYLYEDILKNEPEVLNYIDVLIDGKFIEERKDLNLYWRGSSNQRIIDVKKSINNNTVILYDLQKGK